MELINDSVIQSFPLDAFNKRWPFPWHNFHEFLTPEGFSQLYAEFPSLEFFEYHENLSRGSGQRPHNRYYLAYQKSIYKKDDQMGGIVTSEALTPSWQQFIHELETNKNYQDLMHRILGNQPFEMRYAWHAGMSTNEVSPHCDNISKIATHIFYFNTSEDWNMEWGGALIVLGDKLTPVQNPDFKDFMTSTPIKILDNHSFLFKNTPNAWHGVKALKSPEGKYRRLFNVIFEAKDS
ncbi:MAG: hypothetical protein CK425_09060 [Parachlamydia sp.]|nr:MAG: hypothetical protein CK425_09060 [Parachlamydia sp.]